MDVEDVERFISEDLVGKGESEVFEVVERSEKCHVRICQIRTVLEPKCMQPLT